ncbi:MAG: hemolysin family protein [Myxococcaceae bacterium]|nr:hemolysin family protein [Myxococcaceae bacterium]
MLIVANGVFAAAEIAVVSLRHTRVRELVEHRPKQALPLQELRNSPERFLATVQIGITVVSATAAAFGGASLAAPLTEVLRRVGLGRSAPQVALALVVGVISFLSLVLGELVPKSLALRYSERYALTVARPLRFLSLLMRPVVWFLTASSNLVLRAFGDRTSFTESRLSPEELQLMVEDASRAGSLDPRAGEIVSRAFDFASLSVASVMVPRQEIMALRRHASTEEVLRVVMEEGHSRMPVYEGSIDNIVGYVVAKDLLALQRQSHLLVLEDLMRPVHFVPVTARAVQVLRDMQRERQQMTIVVDEQGGVEGLVTIEDLVEEVVGEIFSEGEVPEEGVRREPDGTVVVPADMPLHEVNRLLDLSLPEGDGFTTLGGLAMARTGTIPPVGTVLPLEDGISLEVLEASPRHIRRLRLRGLPLRAPTSGASPPTSAPKLQ